MLDVELFLNLCTLIPSKHQYFNYSWEYNSRKTWVHKRCYSSKVWFPNQGFSINFGLANTIIKWLLYCKLPIYIASLLLSLLFYIAL